MRLKEYYRRASALPLNVLFTKVADLAGRKVFALKTKTRDRMGPTFYEKPPFPIAWTPIFAAASPQSLDGEKFALESKLRQFLEHQFDFLGSGLTQVVPGLKCRGFDGHVYQAKQTVDPVEELNAPNQPYARKVRALIDRDYQPIDWHLDFKSGYRWSPSTWNLNVPYGHLPGVDIKLPWELARMQHLPIMALALPLAQTGSISIAADDLRSEIRHQVLDFISTNPPRFGVNWRCAMDVGIRVANWVLAVDLVHAAGLRWDAEFLEVFMTSVYQHAEFIYANLEGGKDFRGNHYLADVAGLLYAAAYLPSNSKTDVWFRFAAKAVFTEIDFQFFASGANFEGSTSYHRLSTEMVFYSLVLIARLPEAKKKIISSIEKKHLEKLFKMAEFTRHVLKPDFEIVQFGDNDSGRFFKFDLAGSDLDHRALVSAIYFWLGQPLPEAFQNSGVLERAFLEHQRDEQKVEFTSLSANAEKTDLQSLLQRTFEKIENDQKYVFDLPAGATAGLTFWKDDEFGIYVWKSPRFFLAIRCGGVGQMGRGGHDHNDQLAIELQIDGRNRVLDPGTFVYTSAPKTRNLYRSAHAHFAPRIAGREPGDLNSGLFYIADAHPGMTLYSGPQGFIGSHRGYGATVYRAIEIGADRFQIRDAYEGAEALLELSVDPQDPLAHCRGLRFSPAYGVLNGEVS